MNQHTIPFHLEAALARNPGAEVSTFLAPYERKQGYYTVAKLRRADGSTIAQAVGGTKVSALDNLNTSLSLR